MRLTHPHAQLSRNNHSSVCLRYRNDCIDRRLLKEIAMGHSLELLGYYIRLYVGLGTSECAFPP